ncbi:hypothetical protein SLS62_000545 [Diatrype stigma]|uniref:Uncharacterized protein n=1 Tax=Diatrype stigma TaxID=117547 RepID=A0AAN9UXT1_9PEZI
MSGRGGNIGGAPPFWSSSCEATASTTDLSHTVLAPPGGVTYHPGEQINVNWQSGVRSDVLRVDGPPWAGGFHPASWLWSAFLQSEDEKTSVTIIDNQNFTFGYNVAWKVLDDCTNTAINQTWTIPTSLDVTATVFNVVVVNMTNPDTPSSTTGPAFTIEAGEPTSGGSGSGSTATISTEGAFGAATATESSPPGGGTPSTSTTSIQTPTLSAAPGAGHIPSHKVWVWGAQGLTAGAKAGIGAAAGASALFFLLALILFWKRRRRFLDSGGAAGRRPSPDEEQAAGKADVELDGDSRGTAVAAAAVEAEAPVPRELPATSNDGDISEDYYVKTPVSASALSSSVDFDPCAPRYPSGPVEMPANEMVVAEMPDSSSPHR